MSPFYDCLNRNFVLQAMGRPQDRIDELALPLRGKKRNLTGGHLIDYFGKQRLELTDKVVHNCLESFRTALPGWEKLLERSFLLNDMKARYLELLLHRSATLGLASG